MITACVLSCIVLGAVPSEILFEDDFESPLNPAWHILSGEPRTIADPDTPDRHILELTPSSRMMVYLNKPVQDLVFEARVRFAERRGWVEAPFLLRSSQDGLRALQVYIEQTTGRIIAVRFNNGVHPMADAVSPIQLEIGPWYDLKVVAIGRRIGVWLNGQPALAFVDPEPQAGHIGIRVGDARTYYDGIRLWTPNDEERKELSLMSFAGKSIPEIRETTLTLPDGSKATLRCPDVVEPLVPFEVGLDAAGGAEYALVAGKKTWPIRTGTPIQLSLGGAEGTRTLELVRGGQSVGKVEVLLRGHTRFEAGPLTELFQQMQYRVRGDRSSFRRKGHVLQANPTWVRDHIHEMKAYKYWEGELTSFIDTLIELQHADGFFFEIIGEAAHDHQTFVGPKFSRVEKDDNLCFIRLEMEADVEYLMTEAVHTIWQATGDAEGLRRRLPAVERGIRYNMTDPTRWDAQHGALKRTFSIDTWDFTYGVSDENRRIEPTMPMGIMHGDNSGLYQACRQLAAMHRRTGNAEQAAHWERQGAELRERINRLCYNGKYYTHQILLAPVNTGVKEEDILSLSNTYDITRGLPTHEMAVRIIDEYQARRELRKKTHFAEWFSIDPPYPVFGPYKAGQYINGGIAGFVGGELAKAALNHGREAYGADILHRIARKVSDDGTLFFLYTADGKDMKGGPRGWGAAAVISAMIEGLAGIEDRGAQFKDVTISPRFLAAGIDRARVCARYGPTAAYVAMDYEHRPADRTLRLRLTGVAEKTRVRVLLPEGTKRAYVLEPQGLKTESERVERSSYVALDLPGPLSEGVVEVVVACRNE